MAYIAIKNTEHKGVYKEKEFNKEIYQTKGISHRKFKNNELNEALKWAGVKDIKSGSSVKIKSKKSNEDKNKESKKETSVIENSIYNSIEFYRSLGYSGVIITTKHLGKIIVKTDTVHVFTAKDLYKYKSEVEISKHLRDSFDDILKEEERYRNSNYSFFNRKDYYPYKYPTEFELLEVKNNAIIKVVDKDSIFIDNFRAIPTENNFRNILKDDKIMIDEFVEVGEYYLSSKNFLKVYNNLIIHSNEIISVKPLIFDLPSSKNKIGVCTYYSGDVCKIISSEEMKEIKKILKDAEVEKLTITEVEK